MPSRLPRQMPLMPAGKQLVAAERQLVWKSWGDQSLPAAPFAPPPPPQHTDSSLCMQGKTKASMKTLLRTAQVRNNQHGWELHPRSHLSTKCEVAVVNWLWVPLPLPSCPWRQDTSEMATNGNQMALKTLTFMNIQLVQTQTPAPGPVKGLFWVQPRFKYVSLSLECILRLHANPSCFSADLLPTSHPWILSGIRDKNLDPKHIIKESEREAKTARKKWQSQNKQLVQIQDSSNDLEITWYNY